MAVEFPKNRRPPMLRDAVGGNIKAITPGYSFNPGLILMALSSDEDMFFRSPVMSGVSWSLSGVTKNSSGAILGGCTVHLFYTNSDVLVNQITSDPTTGAFSFLIGPNAGSFYVVAYLPGSPDVAGTTVNTLVPVAQ